MTQHPSDEETLEQQARQPDPGLLREFWWFLRENRKWWLVPLLGSLALVAAVAMLAASPVAPFIYTLF